MYVVRTYIHTYIRTHIHKHIHTYTHTYIHTYIHTHTHIHKYIHTHIHIYVVLYIFWSVDFGSRENVRFFFSFFFLPPPKKKKLGVGCSASPLTVLFRRYRTFLKAVCHFFLLQFHEISISFSSLPNPPSWNVKASDRPFWILPTRV